MRHIKQNGQVPATSKHSSALERWVKAHGLFQRLVGLLGRTQLGQDEGLWLIPCSAVHTFGMRFAIDIVFVSRMGRLLRIDQGVPANRMRGCWRAYAVLELASGSAARLGLHPGQTLGFPTGASSRQ